ncbi:hypothetical protein G4O51_04660 [Candidatus Bathyarchaeota archaeon A05DMB-2]|nr:hypothetical protein [Candidatus Bathyarchaeota archaeon A05DMB-2]
MAEPMTKSMLTLILIAILLYSPVLAATINFAVGATPVSVSINPVTASINVHGTIVFNSTLTGASIPYLYTWFLNGTALSETGPSWSFTPSTRGTYIVYLKVYPSINDSAYNIAQSETAQILVGKELFTRVFGYPTGSSQGGGSGTPYTAAGSRFSLNVESNVTSMSCLMEYQGNINELTRNYTYAFAIYGDNNGTVGSLIAQTAQGTMYYYDNNGPLWYTLDFPSAVHLPPSAYWLLEVHNASEEIMVRNDVIEGYESVCSFIGGMTFPDSLPSPIVTNNYVYCIFASWAVNISASLSPENNDFAVVSNSTVSPLVYNSNANEVNFNVSGSSGTIGYTEAFISKTMLPDVTEASVILDGKQQNVTTSSIGDAWILYFVYPHSTHEVSIRMQESVIPEFSAPSLAVLFAMIGALVYFRKRKH